MHAFFTAEAQGTRRAAECPARQPASDSSSSIAQLFVGLPEGGVA
jgi:hypothetical protein